MANKIQFRRDTASNWTSANPTLSQGELGFETDTNKFKLGDGSTAWNSLSYTFNPSITADQNLNTTSNVTFANVTVPSTVTVDRLAKYGAGFANIEIAEDDNLTPQTDLRSDLGISGKRFGRAYLNTTTVGTKVIFPDASEQTTAWTGSVAYSNVTGRPNQSLDTTSSPTFANLTVNGTMTTLNVTTENVTTENIVTQNFADGTSQTTAWTGTVASSQITSVSTSKVNGLSVVGYTNNYFDLTNVPTQALNPGSDVNFNKLDVLTTMTGANLVVTTGNATINNNLSAGGISVTTGTKVAQAISAGGYPLDVNGQALVRTASTQSSAIMVTNWSSGNVTPSIYMRGYGQNRPGNSSTTPGGPNLTFDGSRGTNASPTALGNGDVMAGILVGGYDGTSWTTDRIGGTPNSELNPFQFIVQTTEAWAGNATTTTNAGSRFFMRTQPQGVQLNATSRQMFMVNSWTAGSTATNTPPLMTFLIGSGVDGSAPTLVPSGGVGTYNTGFGHTKVQYLNTQPAIIGVPVQATTLGSGCDNASLTGTNVLSVVGGRRSGVSGRRDALQSGDDVGAIAFFAQTANNSTGFGSNVGNLSFTMAETAGSTARGTRFYVQTVNSGTTTLSTKMRIDDRNSIYNSDQHTFYEKSGTFSALSLTTSSAVFGSGVVISGYKKTYGDFLSSTTATFTANTPAALALSPGITQSNCSVQNSSQLLISVAGQYNLQFSLQIENTDNGSEHNFWVWLRKNGSDVADSATKYTVAKSGAAVAMLTFNVSSGGSDYFEIVGAADATDIRLPAFAANSQGFTHPAVPSIIANLIPIGA